MVSPVTTASNHGWQFILADLALILFLITLTGLPTQAASGSAQAPSLAGGKVQTASAMPDKTVEVAPAQSLYRPVAGGPTIAEWLADQPHDPRATLTIFAHYRAGTTGDKEAAWAEAEALFADAAPGGLAMRAIIVAGADRDLYASLAYDAPLPVPLPRR